MTLDRRHVRFLASVTSDSEAKLAASCGADIIDCKNPDAGALGALPVATVATIRRALPRCALSATIGDLPCEPDVVAEAVVAMAATGVDYVKVGLFDDGDAKATIARLGTIALGSTRLVGVIIADRVADTSVSAAMQRAGFHGVMLDTALKDGRSLLDYRSPVELRAFIRDAHAHGLFAGLAGSLRRDHIASLLALEPDLLGFRGALCEGSRRTGVLDRAAIRAVRSDIPHWDDTAASGSARDADAPALERTS